MTRAVNVSAVALCEETLSVTQVLGAYVKALARIHEAVLTVPTTWLIMFFAV